MVSDVCIPEVQGLLFFINVSLGIVSHRFMAMPPASLVDTVPWDEAFAADPDIQKHRHLSRLKEVLHVDCGKLEQLLITAVLISFLTGDFNLSLFFIIGQLPTQSSHFGRSVEPLLTAVWDNLLDDHTFALHCCVELVLPAGPFMMIADRFVMESILMRRVMDAATRGVTMALDQVIEQFLGLWFGRSPCVAMENWLTRLAHHQNTRRKFGVRLRAVWNLHCGTLRTITPVNEDIGRQKVSGNQNGLAGSLNAF